MRYLNIKYMKMNHSFIILLAAVFLAIMAVVSYKLKQEYRPMSVGIRPGLPNSHVSLGHPMWDT